jgi:dTDP-4-dehydrorhamnose 3,5-epimerase
VHFLYKCTQFYYPQDECAIRWDDADLAIRWPLPSGVTPVISGRDAAAGGFREAQLYP